MTLRRETLVNAVLLAALAAAPLVATAMDEPYYVNLASRVTILALAGVGLNLALGYGGLVSFGHAAFFGLGGYAAGVLALHAAEASPVLAWLLTVGGSEQMPVVWVAAMLAAGAAALPIGAISLRTTGVYFIMITLAFAQMIYYFAISWPAYGGEDGMALYPRNTFPGVDTDDPLAFFAITFGALSLCLLFTWRIMGARFGAALGMARLNDARLATSGIDPYPLRLTAFVLSAMITGFAGALFADLNGFVGPSMLSWHRSGEIMVFVILGGVGRLCGPVAGAVAFVLLETIIGGETEHWSLFLGLVLLAVVLFAPGGIMGIVAGPARHD